MLENILPFLCFILFFFFLSLLDIKHIRLSNKQSQTICFIALLVLIAFAGCRWSSWTVGSETWIFDYDSYHTVFNNSIPFKTFFSSYEDASIDIKQMDIGYLLWNSIARLLVGDNYNLFLLLTNAILVVFLLKGFVRNNITNGIFFILFFYASRLYLQYNFTLVRQTIALVIIWYAFCYLVQNEMRKYYLFVTIAISFHFSAIVCLFFPLVRRININTQL